MRWLVWYGGTCLAAAGLLLAGGSCNALVFGDVERVPANGTTDGRTSSGDPDSEPGDDDDDATAPSAPRCDPTKPFAAPELGAAFDPTARVARGAVETADRLEAYFISATGSDFVLRRLHRTKAGDPWEPAATIGVRPPPLVGLSLAGGARKLHYQGCANEPGTSSGTFFTCRNWVNVRPALTSVFAGDSTIFVESGKTQTDLFVTATDDSTYYSALLPDSGGHASIVQTPVNAGGPIFNLERALPNVNLVNTDVDKPIVNASETILFFSSNRPGGSAGGSYDIWMATRLRKADDFGAPVFVPELSAPGIDSVSWVSDDGCEVYLDRSDHVYLAKRPL